jgi:CBS-domain-containing membrane protein
MTANPITVSPETSISEASKILLERRFNGLPVVDASGALRGVITQSDLVAQQKRFQLPSFFSLLDGFIPLKSPAKVEEEIARMAAVNVGQAMSSNPSTVAPDTPLEDMAAMMVDGKCHTLPVVDNGTLVGVVGKEDVLRTMLK